MGSVAWQMVRWFLDLDAQRNWVQDCHRVNNVPDHNDFNVEILYQSLSLAQIRKSDIDLLATNSKAANPEKFKDERKPEWEKAFINYLAVIPGVSGILLSYVVREAEDPKAEADLQVEVPYNM